MTLIFFRGIKIKLNQMKKKNVREEKLEIKNKVLNLEKKGKM